MQRFAQIYCKSAQHSENIKIFSKKMKKHLHFEGCYGKLIGHVMCRYALMREVANLELGNFRGVCPILNRATRICVALASQSKNAECRPRIACKNDAAIRILYWTGMKHPAQCKHCRQKRRCPPNLTRRRKSQWQSRRKSESD